MRRFFILRHHDGITEGTMTDETTPDVQPEAAETAVQPETQPEQSGESERTFTQADLDKIVRERLAREREKSELAAKKAADEAARKAAEEQGQFKELYEQAMQAQKAAEERAKALELSNMRREIANRVGLPIGLASRLQGDNETDIEADAKALLATLPKPAAPSLDGGAGRGSQASNAPSIDQIKEQAARLNVNWRLMAEQYGVNVTN